MNSLRVAGYSVQSRRVPVPGTRLLIKTLHEGQGALQLNNISTVAVKRILALCWDTQ